MPKAKWTADGRLWLTKGTVSFQPKSREYDEASWAWLKKNVKHGPLGLKIRVLVWGPDGQAAHEEYALDFAPDNLNAAKRYARALVEHGLAVMTEVRGLTYFDWEHRDRTAVSFGQYEHA